MAPLHLPVTFSMFRQRSQVRDLHWGDVDQVESLLSVLPELYPDGDAWLRRRLDESLAGQARCTLVEVDKKIVGVSIETPKALDRLKLSTFLVADEYRNSGVGGWLIRFLCDRWVREQVSQVHVTVAEHHYDQLHRVFGPIGFLTMARELDRYGLGRHEYVMTCLPSENSWR
ncbi:Predicted acetyltransferase [Mycobacteroides abscessus subsp. bolletii]|uniref:GNAT family N-acetyltransferase n=1 Tax=Mycobacteroides abscessus TaxID=36809 RepID=UPI0009A8E4D2|nr:GNAT family N-acetyltransferase [Mycobacteroides abscessus]SKK41095.1 Predicted acetyltransferase [Mycobacteroides abscessus subsp. bolletii]